MWMLWVGWMGLLPKKEMADGWNGDELKTSLSFPTLLPEKMNSLLAIHRFFFAFVSFFLYLHMLISNFPFFYDDDVGIGKKCTRCTLSVPGKW